VLTDTQARRIADVHDPETVVAPDERQVAVEGEIGVDGAVVVDGVQELHVGAARRRQRIDRRRRADLVGMTVVAWIGDGAPGQCEAERGDNAGHREAKRASHRIPPR
jgi:hypothetical protein